MNTMNASRRRHLSFFPNAPPPPYGLQSAAQYHIWPESSNVCLSSQKYTPQHQSNCIGTVSQGFSIVFMSTPQHPPTPSPPGKAAIRLRDNIVAMFSLVTFTYLLPLPSVPGLLWRVWYNGFNSVWDVLVTVVCACFTFAHIKDLAADEMPFFKRSVLSFYIIL